MGAELGGTAWLIRLVLAWRDAGESAMASATIGIFVLAALVGYVLYRLQERLGSGKAMVVLLCLLVLLTGGLLAIAAVGGKFAALPADMHANWLWIAPALYLVIAAFVWTRWGRLSVQTS